MPEVPKLPTVLCGSTLQEVASVLPDSRYRVIVAEGPAPELEKGVRAPQCFVLFDVDALGQSDCLTALERAGRFPSVVAIAVSSDPDPRRIVAMIRAGAGDYIVRNADGSHFSDLDERLQELAGAGTPNTPRAIALRFNKLVHQLYHDVKNPINNILGFAELLLEIPGTKLNEEQAHFMVRVRSNGNKVLEILTEFIAAADKMAGR
jgi:signal transduction histidine kinase